MLRVHSRAGCGCLPWLTHLVREQTHERLFFIFALMALISGCTATRPASPPTAEERLIQDGKLLYELGRTDDARERLQQLLAETSDQRLRMVPRFHVAPTELGKK
jgi:hypothetical protein